MPLKAIVEDIETVDEGARSFYVQTDNGYVLDVEEVNGMALENVTGLKSALSKERSSVKSLTSKVNKYEKEYDGVDIDSLKSVQSQYESLQAEYEKLKEIDPATEAGKLAEAKVKDTIAKKQKEWQKQHEEAISPLKSQLDILTNQLHTTMVREQGLKGLAEAGVVPEYTDLMLDHVLKQVKTDVTDKGFDAFVSDNEGNPKVKADGSNMTINDLIAELPSKYPNSFQSKRQSGTGTQSSRTTTTTVNKDNMSAGDMIAAGLTARFGKK